MFKFCIVLLAPLFFNDPGESGVPENQFQELMAEFDQGYEALAVPSYGYDYRDHFRGIPDLPQLERQQAFFREFEVKLHALDKNQLTPYQRLLYDHIQYEINLNRERLGLETGYRRQAPAAIPDNGLSKMPKGWYQYRIHFFTSVDQTPDQLYAFGEREVARVKAEIGNIRARLGFATDSAAFYKRLMGDDFFLVNKNEILRRYEEIQATVQKNLGKLFLDTEVDDIAFMEWPDAGPFTPPGYYNPATGNAYGTAVFHFNFYSGRHNRRSMEWLYMHEAVPGHHYQWSMRQKLPDQPAFKQQFYYPGNFEGWGAYVEYFGKDLGLYTDPYSELGKWEWDLVRSTRILIDVGIHAYGWSKEEAIACWKKHIAGQDEIAEREVVRCTNWPAQALSYKVGAWKIRQMSEKLQQENPRSFSLPAFHRAYLMCGATPLEVIEQDIQNLM